MPYADAKYPAKLLPAYQDMLYALCVARDAFAALDWEGEENWRHWEPTRVDSLIARQRRRLNRTIAKAEGKGA